MKLLGQEIELTTHRLLALPAVLILLEVAVDAGDFLRDVRAIGEHHQFSQDTFVGDGDSLQAGRLQTLRQLLAIANHHVGSQGPNSIQGRANLSESPLQIPFQRLPFPTAHRIHGFEGCGESGRRSGPSGLRIHHPGLDLHHPRATRQQLQAHLCSRARKPQLSGHLRPFSSISLDRSAVNSIPRALPLGNIE